MYVKSETEYQNDLCIEKVIEDIAGGGILIASEIAGNASSASVKPGAVVHRATDGKIHLCKSAKLQANATNSATAYRVLKNHEFMVGDIITTNDVASCKAYAITSIDQTNTGYDILNVGTSLGVAMTAANGVHIVEADAEDTSGGASALMYEPTGITTSEADLENDNPDVAIMVRGTVRESLLPYYVPDAFKTDLTARILFL